MALFRINMQTMELDSYSVSLATVVRALLLNDWKGKSAALPGHCPGGPVPAAAYVYNSCQWISDHVCAPRLELGELAATESDRTALQHS